MNEQANFCSQCGTKVSSGAKSCSNCGNDLKNSSTQTPLNENEKVETDIDNPDHDTPLSGPLIVLVILMFVKSQKLLNIGRLIKLYTTKNYGKSA